MEEQNRAADMVVAILIQSIKNEGILATLSKIKRRLAPKNPAIWDKAAYKRYVSLFDTLNESDIDDMRKEERHFRRKVFFSVVTFASDKERKRLKRFSLSVQRQIYKNYELVVLNPEKQALDDVLADLSGDYIALAEPFGELAPHALFNAAFFINSNDFPELLFCDDDVLNKKGRRTKPYFKGGWNEALFEHQNFLLPLAFYKKETVFNKSFSTIVHIPYVLYHWHRKRDGLAKKTAENTGQKKHPAVSVIISSSTKNEFDSYVELLVKKTDYKNMEFMPSFEKKAQPSGELLLFLNCGLVPTKKDWLSIMVFSILKENVGAVGAKIVAKDSSLLHAGKTLGLFEIAENHLHGIKRKAQDYYGWATCERDVGAISGECFLIWKNLYFELGGFDKENLSGYFYDVELCLRIKKVKKRILYNPNVIFVNKKQKCAKPVASQSVDAKAKQQFLHKKYSPDNFEDDFFSPNLSLYDRKVSVARTPRVGKSWRKWIELVCPFWRGDVLIIFEIAMTAAIKYNKKIRLHVSKDICEWLSDFPYKETIEILPIDIRIPNILERSIYLKLAIEKVASREDSSGLIICPHPTRSVRKMGMDLAEAMLFKLGLPIYTTIINVKPTLKNDLHSFVSLQEHILLEKSILLHPNGGWKTKSMNQKLIRKISEIAHKKGFFLLQIGGANDFKSDFVDGYAMGDFPLSIWHALFVSTKALIGVDSWTSHFAPIVNANQVVVFGSTTDEDVASKRHYENQDGQYLAFDSNCSDRACFKNVCEQGRLGCPKMTVDENAISSFLDELS